MLIRNRDFHNLQTSNSAVTDDALTKLRQIGLRHKGEGPAEGFVEEVRRAALSFMPELFAELHVEDIPVQSPVDGVDYGQPIIPASQQPGFISIKRAGDGFVPPAKQLLPQAGFGSLTLARDHETHEPTEIDREFPSSLDLTGRSIIYVLDLMLATGGSASYGIQVLKEAGAQNIHFIGLMAAPDGVEFITKNHPDVLMTIATLDECLNNDAYIIPGFGDAGDLLYGTKAWQARQAALRI